MTQGFRLHVSPRVRRLAGAEPGWARTGAVVASAALAALVLPAVTRAAASGQDEPTTLEPGRTIECSLAGGQRHAYRLALAPGDVARLTVDQRGIDVVVVVDGANGKSVAEFDRESRPQGQEPVIVLGEASGPGPVRVNVSARYPKAAAAGYAIRVDEIRAATDRDRDEFDAHKLAAAATDLDNAGKFAESLKLLTQAVMLAERAQGPNDPYLGNLLTRTGEVSRTTGDPAAAERLFTRAIAVNEAALGRENPQTAYSLLRLGALKTALGDFAEAERLLDEALAITERTLGPDHPRVAQCLLAETRPHDLLDDYGFEVSGLQRALAIEEKTLDPGDFALLTVVNNLGDVYVHMGNYQAAQPYVERALVGIEKRFGPDNWRVTYPLINLGRIAREAKQYDRALELLSRAYAIREKAYGSEHSDTAAALILIGTVHHARGDYAKALETFHRVLDILEGRAPYFEYTRMAIEDASDSYAAAGDVAHALEYWTRANHLQSRALDLNLAIGSEREKLLYAEHIADGTDRTITLHAREAPDNQVAAREAMLTLLQRKGRVLDAMSGSVEALRQRMSTDDRSLLDQLRTVTTQLATLALGGTGRTAPDEYKERLASMEAQRERLEADIGSRSAAFRAQSLPVTVAAVQEAIPERAALIEIAIYRPYDPKTPNKPIPLGEARYIAYTLRHTGAVAWADLGLARDIDQSVAALRLALHTAARHDVKKLARALDEKVLNPIRPVVGDATQLLISPDGALNLIPFEALVDERGHYAVERFSISYLTSGRDLLRLQLPRPSKTAPLIVADPTFGAAPLLMRGASGQSTPSGQPAPPGQTSPASKLSALRTHQSVVTGPDLSAIYFTPLPGAAAEARALKVLYPNATLLTGTHATKAALMHAEAPALLHIATHGFFLQNATPGTALHEPAPAGGTAASGQPAVTSAASGAAPGTRSIDAIAQVDNPLLRSGLALTGANMDRDGSDDGILTALEASTLNLWGTHLVTLSGCDTGVGDVKNGEGIYGLRRAFLLAGAETVIMSLWPVSDYSTRDVMTSYYAGLKQGLGRGEALRRAQLAMLKSKLHRHPFYWASFIQAGDWTPLDARH